MKVLSLKQPWAALVITKSPYANYALKTWETRSWKPSDENLQIIRKEGLLIHASKAWEKPEQKLMGIAPFSDYAENINPLLFGAIIGMVTVGRIVTTEHWLIMSSKFEDGAAEHWWEEKEFGDYSPKRWAWEFLTFEKFDKPILNVSGSLNLWNYDSQRLSAFDIL